MLNFLYFFLFVFLARNYTLHPVSFVHFPLPFPKHTIFYFFLAIHSLQPLVFSRWKTTLIATASISRKVITAVQFEDLFYQRDGFSIEQNLWGYTKGKSWRCGSRSRYATPWSCSFSTSLKTLSIRSHVTARSLKCTSKKSNAVGEREINNQKEHGEVFSVFAWKLHRTFQSQWNSPCSQKYLLSHVKKTSFGESLAKSHAYNPIRDFRRDAWRARKVSPRVSDWIICMTLGKTLRDSFCFSRGVA